ncbi:MAG TPA: glycosyltransferase family 4 protein [Ignavibacteriaceae bacterium]|nr:glycosyltransferase family 4 protein [Ignavibacteriaceae bacterium]
MKVVHLSSSDLSGGAAIACKRIVDAQAINGIDSALLVQKKISSDPRVYSTTSNILSKLHYNYRLILDEGYIRLLTNQSRGRFSNPFFGKDISNHPLIVNADVINLQWINGGFLSLNTLRKIGSLRKPIVWTLHDMWAFTGGCHYVADCDKYLSECKQCPALRISSNRDCSSKIFIQKREIYNNLDLTILTTSRWLGREASRSGLLKNKKVVTIPTPIDSDLYKPLSKNSSREKMKLPLAKKIILFGAMNLSDERKGFKYLIEALKKINTLKEASYIELAVFGKIDESVLTKIPFKVNQLGRLKSETEIVAAYNSADIFAAPSLEDNLPNTIMESMSCGTPAVAFNAGGIPDMIDNNQNGILAKLKSSDELSDGLLKILFNDELRKKMSEESRKKVLKNFNSEVVVNKYKELYSNLIENRT